MIAVQRFQAQPCPTLSTPRLSWPAPVWPPEWRRVLVDRTWDHRPGRLSRAFHSYRL